MRVFDQRLIAHPSAFKADVGAAKDAVVGWRAKCALHRQVSAATEIIAVRAKYVIDDYVKDRAEANSNSRDKTWGWFTDVFMPRFSATSGLLILCTRWHVDDLLGRYLLRHPNIKVLRYPAIAEQDEVMPVTKYHRTKGEALFSEFKPLELLQERRREMTTASWEAEYQQNPIIAGGGVIPIDKLRVLPIWTKQGIKRTLPRCESNTSPSVCGIPSVVSRRHTGGHG